MISMAWIGGTLAVLLLAAITAEAWIKRNRPRRPLASYRPEMSQARRSFNSGDVLHAPSTSAASDSARRDTTRSEDRHPRLDTKN
ncbi:hypothetical protein [Thalassovita taeanensis]|uniref:Uncharacterized protein n=1 Tax=Thalassovita taeanensis TaxID=657014 RepID=A0A1H8YUL5_9RHOB|nr:hypothetical protein [Thalassovita taeanensis]SEP55914.1 hypothetical protein SAMN04488092_101135 [Thalassovita taeanensis]